MVLALSLFWIAGAQAVHDEAFQLDGDVVASTTTTVPPGPNPPAETQLIDWDSLFNADGSTKSTLPTGFDEANLVRDFNTNASGTTFLTNDGTTFATGSKDTLPISGWQCNLDNNVNSKIDVMNAYAATYTASDGDEILYFGIERNVNTGDANVGFWFLQSTVGCVSTGASVTFSGEHQDGDVLVVSEFSGGGTVSTINAYRWDRPNPNLPGSLNPTPIANGVDCRSATTGVDDTICGASNRAAQSPITIPWLGAVKTTLTHSLSTALFFEGGLNLTEADLGGTCFNTFLADTRSSTSLTATLFDFTSGQLGACESAISSAQTWEPNDTATVTVTDIDTWGGTVDFTLFEGSLDCTGTSVFSDSDTVSNTDPEAATDNSTFTADATEDYSWLVEFTPDAATAAAGVLPATHCETTELVVTN
jgi:hypothetical protein